MLDLKIAFRNIFRRKRRSVLTALTMIGGCVLSGVSIGLADGSYDYVIDMFTRNRLGHIQIHYEDYLSRPSLYKTISDYNSFEEVFIKLDDIVAWTPRIYSAGLASVGDKTTAVQIIGIEQEREIKITRFDKKVCTGQMISDESAYETMLGKSLAEILDAKIGDDLVIVSQAADGSIANDLYEIVGLIESGNEVNDRTAMYLSLSKAQELLVLEERVHEIAIIAEKIKDSKKLARQIALELDDPHLNVAPWQEVAKSFYNAMTADKRGNHIMIAIIILIVAVGVLNTVLMSVLERTREYGIFKAIGTRPGQIINQVLFEILIIAAGSVIVGTGISAAVNYWLSIDGIRLTDPITYGGVVFDRMFCVVNIQSLVIPPVIVILSAVLVSIFPALKAARLEPAKAMRIH